MYPADTGRTFCLSYTTFRRKWQPFPANCAYRYLFHLSCSPTKSAAILPYFSARCLISVKIFCGFHAIQHSAQKYIPKLSVLATIPIDSGLAHFAATTAGFRYVTLMAKGRMVLYTLLLHYSARRTTHAEQGLRLRYKSHSRRKREGHPVRRTDHPYFPDLHLRI